MGSIVSARAVGPVKAGRTVRVRLLVRVYRGPVRRVSFRMRIPRGARGLLPVTIHGPAAPTPATANSLSSQLVGLAVGEQLVVVGDREWNHADHSLDELSDAIAAISTYDGLYANVPGQRQATRLPRPVAADHGADDAAAVREVLAAVRDVPSCGGRRRHAGSEPRSRHSAARWARVRRNRRYARPFAALGMRRRSSEGFPGLNSGVPGLGPGVQAGSPPNHPLNRATRG